MDRFLVSVLLLTLMTLYYPTTQKLALVGLLTSVQTFRFNGKSHFLSLILEYSKHVNTKILSEIIPIANNSFSILERYYVVSYLIYGSELISLKWQIACF